MLSNYLSSNRQALGLDPARIKYVIVTHGHSDHYGGSRYIQQKFGAKLVASASDWGMMTTPLAGSPFAKLVPPRKDMVASDGDKIVLGRTTVTLFVTPGYTPGTLSLIFPVFDKGVRHMAGRMGAAAATQPPRSVSRSSR